MAFTIGEPGEIRTPPAAWLTAVPLTSAARVDARGWYQHALGVDSASVAKDVVRLAVRDLSPSEREATHALTPHPLVGMDADGNILAVTPEQDVLAALNWSVMARADQRVVTHAGILYRVIQVGDLRVPVGGISGVMTLADWRGRGYARAVVASATAFVGMWLWAPFALIICPPQASAFYERLGWRNADAAIW